MVPRNNNPVKYSVHRRRYHYYITIMLSRTSRHGTCPNIRIASTLENAGKIHQTQEQLTPSLGLNSQLHTSKRYAKYKPVGLSPIITIIQINKLDKQNH